MAPLPQEPVRPLGVATINAPGKVSVKATPVSATVSGLVIVKLSVVLLPTMMLAAPNALLMDGGPTTARLAEAVPPVPPSVEVTFPVVLFLVPAVVPVTFTENGHDLLAPRVAARGRLMRVVAWVIVTAPP